MKTHTLLAATLLLACQPAWSQTHPAAPLGPSGEQARSISFQNLSGATVTAAHATMTDGKGVDLSKGPVRPTQAREVVVPRSECLAGVDVRLDNGQDLNAKAPNDCRATRVVVNDGGLQFISSAVPGAQQRGGRK
jgi:hypothetical protein